ncbi:hypothetical protein [Micromonospora tarensis]|uniref:Uncharacterized protein n=1 Tax=Micromonospora tarensis TaxID=2806100 RepID=A0ABS1YK47_9ACTN|nr:hypothetical protein [Micromonospora tarensis]MBM0277802.1 hypothetical protein [Micromonospora tarensis]
MTRAQYEAWQRDGEPFRLMTPADDLLDQLRAHGYTVYAIGNESHMLASPAEDHTPFSQTGWPGTAKYGVGYAIDIMPPKAGQKSKLDGKPLPSLQQLGAQLVADRKAGVPGISWLKYINWEPERNNGGPCYQDSWKPNYARRSSTDRGHIHASGRTGMESSTVARGYDPVARIRGEDDMDSAQDARLKRVETDLAWLRDFANRALNGQTQTADGKNIELGKWIAEGQRDRKAILAALAQLAGRDFTDEPAIIQGVLAGLTPEAIAAAIPAALTKQVAEELARRLVA